MDSSEDQMSFKAANGLSYDLVADMNHEVCDAFSVEWSKKSGGAHRQAILIKSGEVIYRFKSIPVDEYGTKILDYVLTNLKQDS